MCSLRHNEEPTELPIANKDASSLPLTSPYPSPSYQAYSYLSYRTYPYLSCQTCPSLSSRHPPSSSDCSVRTYYTPIKLNNFPTMQIISKLHSLFSLIADDVSGLWQYVLLFRYLNRLRIRLLN